MLRKTLLCALITLVGFELFSQCTPEDCSGSLPPYGGICDEEVAEGEVNMDYDDFESFVLTQECFNAQEIDPGNPDIVIQILEIYNFSFSGLPSGIDAETNETSYSSMSGSPTLGCVALTGVPEDAGLFEVSIDFESDIDAYVIGSCPGGISIGQTQDASYILNLVILPDASFEGLEDEYCEQDDDVELIVTGTPGGEFSGPGVSGTTFSPSEAGPGFHTITYTVSAMEGNAVDEAENSSSIEVEVLEALEFWADMDGDGFGDPDNSMLACEEPDDYVENDEDCDDTNDDINPDEDEECDGLDNDCDGDIDEDFDEDEDGVTTCEGDCDDDDDDIYPGAEEVCDGVDNNCDGDIDEGFDVDGDGFTSCDGDCDDDNADLNPGAQEVCDGIDNNCNGVIDEGFDVDGDGFTSCDGDCDDANPDINPMGVDTCGMDNNCDGVFPDNVMNNISLTLCQGDTIIYNGEVISEIASYTYILTASNGCDSVIVLEIMDGSINPTIAIEIDSVCATGEPIDLAALVSPEGGVFEGSGIDGNMFVPELADIGYNEIVYTIDDGECVESISFEILVTICTSVIDKDLDQSLQVYPNPSNGLLVLEIGDSKLSAIEFSLHDIQGRKLMTDHIDVKQNLTKINYQLDHLSNGVYLIKLESDMGIVSRRIFLEK